MLIVLKQEYRLRRSAEITRTRRKGKRVHSPVATLYYTPRISDTDAPAVQATTRSDVSRFCFVVGKRVGNAVVRNRAKRRLREIIRLVAKDGRLAEGWDCIIVAKPTVSNTDHAQLESTVHGLLKRANLLAESLA